MLYKKLSTKWKKWLFAFDFFHNDWHFFAIKMKEVLYKLLTVLIKCVIIFYHLVCCFLNTSKKAVFLFCCWPGRVEFLLTYTRAIVNAACQISIRNQSAVCYSFSGSRRHFDVIWRSLSLPSANNTSSAINNLFLVYLVSGNRYNTFSSELKCLNYVIFVVESTVIHCGQIISRRVRNK